LGAAAPQAPVATCLHYTAGNLSMACQTICTQNNMKFALIDIAFRNCNINNSVLYRSICKCHKPHIDSYYSLQMTTPLKPKIGCQLTFAV